MMAAGRKKTPKTYAMDDYLIERVAALSDTKKFGSQSNIVSTAVAEFLARNECTIAEQQIETINKLIENYLKSPEGEAIIRSIIRKILTPKDEDQDKIFTGVIE